jgi:hypothetical protein
VAALILLVVGGGGFAGWYFFLRPATANPTAAESAVPRPATPSPPSAQPPPSTPDSDLVAYDRIGDSLAAIVQGYHDRVTQFGSNPVDCTALSQRLMAVEDVWTAYNQGKRRVTALDAGRAARDQTLYAAVDSVERHFDRSGCARP